MSSPDTVRTCKETANLKVDFHCRDIFTRVNVISDE